MDDRIDSKNYFIIDEESVLQSYYSQKELNDDTTELYSEVYNLETEEKKIQRSITEISNINGMRIEKNTVYDSLYSDLGELNYLMCYDVHERLISEKINTLDGLLEGNLEYKGLNRSLSFFKSGNPYKNPILNYSQASFVYNNNNQLISCDFKDENNKFITSYLEFSKYEGKYNLYGMKLKESFLNPDDSTVFCNVLGYSQYNAEDSFNHKYLLSFKYTDENGIIVKPKTEYYSHMNSEVYDNYRKSTYYSLMRFIILTTSKMMNS